MTDVDTPADMPAWHAITAEQACEELGVDATSGLDAAEVERRREEFGANRLDEQSKEPGWRAFLRQYRDLMQLVLLGAAVVSMVALQEFSTGVVIIGLTVLNAVLGLNQEGKAAESVAALQKMLVIRAHVRRGGELADVPAEELVPGDVVSFEAGDKVPADGRLLVAATLEIEGRADRREHARPEDGRAGRRRRGCTRGSPGHGLHELDRHTGARRDGRHCNGDGH
jgi:P-type Ca2+ transporter type 2C